MKNIAIIDDSTLMRRVLSDIINEEDNYQVVYTAENGEKGYELIRDHYKEVDLFFLDINMPKLDGIGVLERLHKQNIHCRIVIFSTLADKDGDKTIKALELGALDFLKKPDNVFSVKENSYSNKVLKMLKLATMDIKKTASADLDKKNREFQKIYPEQINSKIMPISTKTKKIVAIACSTGGPKALQQIIPLLPNNLAAPVIVVQHMPEGFTNSLAVRLNSLSSIEVKEAEEEDALENGKVYIAKGGKHLVIKNNSINKDSIIHLSDESPVGGLRPCANKMYESLVCTDYSEVICVVLTGMGSDGTIGIKELSGKKNVYIIGQDEESSVVYGMPKAIALSGLNIEVLNLNKIADAIIRKAGVL